MSRENIKSNIKIADDVIAIIAGIATTSVEEVAALGEGINLKAVPFIGSNSLKKGVIIEKDENKDNLLIKITVSLKQGVDIKNVCYCIQEKVKEAIESMLDLEVKEVKVRVAMIED